jgi:hypothetical protein
MVTTGRSITPSSPGAGFTEAAAAELMARQGLLVDLAALDAGLSA